jgi:hypothetical protein
MGSKIFIMWNVRGINSRARIQEIKLHVIDDFAIRQLLDPGFDYSYLPSSSSHEGILVTWKSASWSVASTVLSRYVVSVRISMPQGVKSGGSPQFMGLQSMLKRLLSWMSSVNFTRPTLALG